MSSPRRIQLLDDRIQTLSGLFSPEECQDLVRLADGIGFSDAPITTARGFVMAPELRNNTRVILDDVPRAEALWRRISPWVPERVGRFWAVGINERFRFYRYAPGEYFRWHLDGAFYRDDQEQSLLTLMIYLNGDFEGGTTDFDVREGPITVVPESGLALIFEHRLLHQGAPVRRGIKHVLRTDVMYRLNESP